MDNKILSTVLEEGCRYPFRYETLLNHFIKEVESLSAYGSQIWDQLFEDYDIYLPDHQQTAYHIGWQERQASADRYFHLQCAHLVHAGVYEAYDMGKYCYFPYSSEWRKGEEQTAEAMLKCRGNKANIAALFIYALLNSEDRHNPAFHKFIFIEDNYQNSHLTPKDKKLLWNLKETLRNHLEQEKIWHYWAQTCTSLLPVINDRNPRKYLFRSG